MMEFLKDLWSSFSKTLGEVLDTVFSFIENIFFSYPIISSIFFMLTLAGCIYAIVKLRSQDRNYSKAWIYYLLYFASFTFTARGCALVGRHIFESTLLNNIFISLMIAGPAVLTIFGGWGIRQSGMIDGMYIKKKLRHKLGEILLFVAWMLIIRAVWGLLFYDTTEWLGKVFQEHTVKIGALLSFVILIASTFLAVVVLYIWVHFIVPHLFVTAGKRVLYIMTATISFAMMHLEWHWVSANYDSLATTLMALFGAGWQTCVMLLFMKVIAEMRCPVCRHCKSKLTKYIDHGYSQSSSSNWEKMSNRDVDPEHSNAVVTDAERLVETVKTYHDWTTEHTCQRCFHTWAILHSRRVSTSSHTIRERWTEHY